MFLLYLYHKTEKINKRNILLTNGYRKIDTFLDNYK